MPTYILLVVGNNHSQGNLMKVLIGWMLELEKLEDRLQSKIKLGT
jgi:hypothetical protein